MPLEIRELIIRTQIVTETHNHSYRNDWQREIEMKALVDQCVSKVVKALKKKTER